MDATSNGFIDRLEAGFMVPGKEQLELRDEFEKVLPHEPCCDFVAAGERFDLAFVPPAAFVSLYRGDKARAPQPRQIRRMPVLCGRNERLDGGGAVIVADTSRLALMNVDLPFAPAPCMKKRECA
jgi:hypothetical protein